MPLEQPLSGKKLLVVDDEELLREILSEQLQIYGASTLEAASGNAAVKILEKETVDAVISDIRMAEGTGIELLTAVRKKNKDKPVILLVTAYTEAGMEDIYAMGANAIFSKPFKIEAIVDSVVKHLSPPQERFKRKFERVQADFPLSLTFPSLEKAIEAKVVNFGRGGMCLSLTGALPKEQEEVFFEIHSSDGGETWSGRGICRWRKITAAAAEKVNFIGIEFVSLSDEMFARVSEWIKAKDPTAFIPKPS